jgi:hypothetical protein
MIQNARRYRITSEQRDKFQATVETLMEKYPHPSTEMRLSIQSAQSIVDDLTTEMQAYEEQQVPLIEEAIAFLLNTHPFVTAGLIVDYLQLVKRIEVPYLLVQDYLEKRKPFSDETAE